MKKLLFIIIVGITLNSCERSGRIDENFPGNPNTHFELKILDDYFVISLAFDSKGNAWIGTFKQGLIKYNSQETVVYDSTNSILPGDIVIWDIAIDSKDNVWMGCDGLMKYDGTSFTLFNSANTPIPEDFVYSIAIDSKDNVWFTSCRFRQGGFVKYDGIIWTVYTPDNSELPVNAIKSIAIDRNDNVWLALAEIVNQTYLIKITGSEWTIYTEDDLGFSPYYFGNIDIDSKNRLCGAIDYSLSSTISNTGPQVFIFNGETTEQLRFDDITNIASIKLDNADNIWCAAYGGYAVYDGENWSVDDSTFKDAGVFEIEQAKDNRIWIGTGSGIYIND